MTYHRFVLHHRVPDYLLLGWMALPSLDGHRPRDLLGSLRLALRLPNG